MSDSPPVLLEPIGILMNVLKRHSDRGGRRPKMFPGTVREAAQYWIDHQQPPDDYKEAVEELFKNGQLTGYRTPYHDRLAYALRAFLKLNDLYQTLVIEAAERGIWYRGEGMNIFPEIIKQADEMMKDPEAYAKKHAITYNSLLGKQP